MLKNVVTRLSRLPIPKIAPAAPTGPGCSKWFSCSCCHSQKAPPVSEQQHAVREPMTRFRTLPLPPRLPFSPNSPPVKRHFDALALAITNTDTDAAWSVFLGLHSSLRPHIPNQLFMNLLRHILTHHLPKQRWHRARTLLTIWRNCGMAYRTLGSALVESALESGLVCYNTFGVQHDKWRTVMMHLWDAAVDARNGQVDKMDVGLRRGWIRYVRKNYDSYLESGCSRPSMLEGMETPLERLHGKAINDIPGVATLLRRIAKVDPAAGLKTAIQCSQTGYPYLVSRHLEVLMAIILRQTSHLPKFDAQGMIETHATGQTRQLYAEAYKQVHAKERFDPHEEATQLLSKSLEPAVRSALEILLGSYDFDDLQQVSRLCIELSRTKSEWTALYELYVATLYSYRYTDRADLVTELAQLPQPDNVHAQSSRKLFKMLLATPLEPAQYVAARKLYPIVRPMFRWFDYPAWKRLLLTAVRHRNVQTASRLYSDGIADGLIPGKGESLELIIETCRAAVASRPIMLERFVRDFVEFHPEHNASLADALVQGLCGSADGAVLATQLCRRLGPLSDEQAVGLLRGLARLPNVKQRKAMMDILGEKPLLPEAYGIIIGSLAKSVPPGPDTTLLSHPEALDLAVRLFRQMIGNRISPTPRVVSALIVLLLHNNRLDEAKTVFDSAVSRARIRSAAVGRLMVNLAVQGRAKEAEDVERAWRESMPREKLYDMGVIGARVLVDTIQGKEVDLEQVQRRTGWAGNKPFLRFVEETRKRLAVPDQAGYAGLDVNKQGLWELDEEEDIVPPFTSMAV